MPAGRRTQGARVVVGLGLAIAMLVGCAENGRRTPAPEPTPQPSQAPETTSVSSSTPSPPAAAPPAAAHPDGPPRSCALELDPEAPGTMAVSVVVQNRTQEAFEARYFHPLVFHLEVWADHNKLPLDIPAFDGPVEPRSVTVPAGERVPIPTPVTLRFAPDGKRKTDSPFEWLILSPPTDVWLRAKKVLADTPELRCELKAHFR